MNLEGIMSKRLDSPYRSGRVGDWTKAKCRAGQEVVIGGWTRQAGQIALVARRRASRRHAGSVGRVGTGFGARQAQTAAEAQAASRWRATQSPFDGTPSAAQGRGRAMGRNPKLVAEIEFAGWTGGRQRAAGSVQRPARRQARATRCVAERPASGGNRSDRTCTAKRSRKTPRTPRRKSTTSASAGECRADSDPMSSWACRSRSPTNRCGRTRDDGKPVTKLDLARYFESVGSGCCRTSGPAVLDHPRARRHRRPALLPASRHEGHVQPAARCVRVSGDHEPYLQIDRVEGLAALAQIAATGAASVELRAGRAGSCRAGWCSTSIPRPEVAFDAVIAAAREMQRTARSARPGRVLQDDRRQGPARRHAARAEQAQQGATGPRRRRSRRPCARKWPKTARPLPDQHGEEATHRTHLPRLPAQRSHVDRGRAAVAALREGAPVSMPLNWSQVKAGLDPDALHYAHGACVDREEHGLGRLLRCRASAGACDPQARRPEDEAFEDRDR